MKSKQWGRAKTNACPRPEVVRASRWRGGDDPFARSEPQFEAGEEREKLIDRSKAGRMLAVAIFIIAPGDDDDAEKIGSIRILSARAATPTEEALYRR